MTRWSAVTFFLLFAVAGRLQAGTTGCCAPDGSCQNVPFATCEELGGLAVGPCSICSQITCPPPACIVSTESCTAPHATPGCDYLGCCEYVCSQLPHCCTESWTADCVQLNQNCGDLFIVTTGCVGDGSCQAFPTPGACYDAGCSPGSPEFDCAGDGDGDGIDDACGCPPSTAPRPIPPTMIAGKNALDSVLIDVEYDVETCNASEHVLFLGAVGDFDQVIEADCLIGNGGTHTFAPPAGDVWLLVAGREGNRYSSVGQATSGERVLTGVELLCGGDLQPDTSAGCP
jgi:hypothetical protein